MSSLLFEDLKAGDKVPAVTFNLTLHRLVLHAGGNRDLTPLHFDDAAAQAAGARGAFINNVFALGMWEHAVRAFAGDGAVIHAVDNLKMGAFNVVGDAVTTRGETVRKWTDGGVGFAELALESYNHTVERATVGPGTVLISLPRRGVLTDAESLEKRFAAASAARADAAAAPLRRSTGSVTSGEADPIWEAVAESIGTNLLLVPAILGADRVESSVVRRLCEPLELASLLHYDSVVAQQWGYAGAVGPVCGLATVYPDPGSWKPGQPTNYPCANRDAEPGRLGGVENGEECRQLPFPTGSISILTSVSLELDAPVLVGDLISVRAVTPVRVVPKRTSVGAGAFVTFVLEVWNERHKVGEVTKVQFQYVPDSHP